MTGLEDILDGYFPLQVSVADLLARRGLEAATLSLRFAPLIEVPGLPPDAPVPLNIRAGRAGLILHAELHAGGAGLRGTARWRWLDGGAVPGTLDPMIRLAEPAVVAIGPAHASAGTAHIATRP